MNQEGKICVCGGGHIGHSLAAAFTRISDVSVLTRRPEAWAGHLVCRIGDGAEKMSPGSVFATSNPAVVKDASLVVVSLPRFAVADELRRISPFVSPGQTIAFIPGMAGLERIASELAERGVEVVAFQRVPFIARISRYGRGVTMSEARSTHRLALSDPASGKRWKVFFESHLGGKVEFLTSFWSFTFSNSNPLLHPARLVELLKGGRGGRYDRCPLFYAEWTDASSELYVEADREMHRVFSHYAPDAARVDYESVLTHYEVSSPMELTRKIRSIPAFKEIVAPWVEADGVWVPDLTSRYFTEDIPFGTKIISDYARRAELPVPTIDYMIENCPPRNIKF